MKPTQKITFSINPLIVIVILIIVILGMLAIWRPWMGKTAERTITATGQAEITSTPDEFVFSPYFQRIGDDSAKLKAELDTFGNKLLADVTKLGVSKDNITLNSTSSDQSIEPYPAGGTSGANQQKITTLAVTVIASTKELAQKVQDYLATTDAKGQLTATPRFSKQKRNDLENQARDKAAKDARSKAEQSAKNLGSSVGKVITIKESSSSPVYPLASGAEDTSAKSSLSVTPGKDTVTLGVEVVFELQ